jgi:hypothetical protein
LAGLRPGPFSFFYFISIMNVRAKRPNPQKEVDAWNNTVPVGAEVDYVDHPGAKAVRFTTRTAAEVLSGHTSVVWLNGKCGCVATSHCRLVAGA